MPPLSTPHAHTVYVDGKSTAREMALSAVRKGFQSLGFSEHGRQAFDFECCLNEERERAYQDEVRLLQREFAGRLRIRLGVEWDSEGLCDPTQYEYIIASTHYFRSGDYFFTVDSEVQTLRAGVKRLFGGDFLKMNEAYFRRHAEFVLETRPQIIGHFDLPTKFNEDGSLFDESDRRYLRAGFEALERMRATDALLEVNTGAIARGYRKTPYPALPFLRFWRELGGRATVSSDCHLAEKLDCAYDLAFSWLREAGYPSFWALGTGEKLFEEYPL